MSRHQRHPHPVRGPASRLTAGLAIVGLALAACTSGTTQAPSATQPAGSTAASGTASSAPAATEAAAADAKISLMTWGDAKYAKNQFELYKKTFPDKARQQTIDVVVGGANDGEAVSKLRLALSSGKGIPDIMQLNYSAVAEFASQGQLTDLQACVDQYLAGMSESAKTLMQYDGKYVAFPYEVKEKLWYYRKDMFDAAGIDVAQVKSQADFIEAGKKLQAKYPKSFIWNVAPNPQAYILGEITSGNGSQVYDKNAKKFVVDTDPGLHAAFIALRDLRSSGVVNANFDDFTPDWQKGLADGTIASVPIASWFSTFLPQYAPDGAGKWGVTKWPEIGGAEGGSEAGGSVFVIPAKATTKAAACDFLTSMFMTTKGSSAVFKQAGQVPNVIEAQSDPGVVNNAYFGADLINAFKAAGQDYKLFPYDPASLKEQSILQNALAKYLGGKDQDPSTALAEAQQQMTAQIGDPWQQ
jgi:ABC-type glycerol-3-phosphate transport system substrate-binding protein